MFKTKSATGRKSINRLQNSTKHLVRSKVQPSTGTSNQRLSDLLPGTTGKILTLTTPNRRLQRKLMNLGFIPGNEVKVMQRTPAYLIEVGFTQIALDKETCQLIQVISTA